MRLRASLFWDTDINSIDLKKHKKAIIERVLLRGTQEEFIALIQFYGKKTIRTIALQARYLDNRTLAFCCTLFRQPKTTFRCYNWQRLNPSPWDY
jgi:hypothetical protein